jgi:hypothetical protein
LEEDALTMTELDRERLKELYLPPTEDFTFVDVPELRYAMLDGHGDPDGEAFRHAVRWLFSAIDPIKRVARERMGKDFVEPPLECLWWTDDPRDFVAGTRDAMRWRPMILTADWVDHELFAQAVATTSERLGEVPDTLRLEQLHEGRSVQIMVVGDYASSAAALARRLHERFLPEHGLRPNGLHHEIYLSDPNRVAAERMRTVLRQPVASA